MTAISDGVLPAKLLLLALADDSRAAPMEDCMSRAGQRGDAG